MARAQAYGGKRPAPEAQEQERPAKDPIPQFLRRQADSPVDMQALEGAIVSNSANDK